MRKAITVVLVIVALAVAADFVAASAAEHVVAKRLRQQLGLSSDPSVRINGFPFVTQALDGHYVAIDVRAGGVSVGPLHDLDVEATLHDVEAPLSQVSSGDLHSVPVGRVDGRVRIKDSDLGRAIGLDDLRIQQPPADSSGRLSGRLSGGESAPIRLVASTGLGGQRTEVIGTGVIELTGGLVRIAINDVRLSRDDAREVTLPKGIRQSLLKALNADVKPGALPFAVTPTSVWVENGSVVVEGTASNVTLGQAGPG